MAICGEAFERGRKVLDAVTDFCDILESFCRTLE